MLLLGPEAWRDCRARCFVAREWIHVVWRDSYVQSVPLESVACSPIFARKREGGRTHRQRR